MKLGLNRLRQRYGRLPLIYPTYALALDFDSAVYEVGGVRYAAVSSIPGYAYTRTGAKAEQSASGIVEQFAANAPGIATGVGFWSRAAATNLLLNAGAAASLATQSVTLPASAHTLSFIGTGSVALSGAFVGTLAGTGASNRVVLTFTPTAGAVTFTVTGSVTYSGLIAGNHPDGGPIILTGASAVAAGADALKETPPTITDVDQIFFAKISVPAFSGGQFVFELDTGAEANRIVVYLDGGVPTALVNVASVAQHSSTVPAIVASQPTTLVVRRLAGNWRFAKIIDGVITWGLSAAGTFPTGINLNNVGCSLGGTAQLNGLIIGQGIRVGTFTTDAEVIAAASVF